MYIKSDNLQYNTLGCWVHRLINQVSDVPSIIIFHTFFQNSLQKSFQFIFVYFYNFTKITIKSFKYSKSKPATHTVLFSIYQNNTWIIRHMVNETIDQATQHIILKIVWFHIFLGSLERMLCENGNLWWIGFRRREGKVSICAPLQTSQQYPSAWASKSTEKTWML